MPAAGLPDADGAVRLQDAVGGVNGREKQKLHAVRAQRGVRHDGAHDALREQPEHVERAAQVEGHEEQHAERGRKNRRRDLPDQRDEEL